MILQSIELEGFRTFKDRQKVVMPTLPGLYFIRGVNAVDKALFSNDVGKSTLLDAMFWCCYGETTRGLKANSVLSWKRKTACVTVEWIINGQVRAITRKQSPNEIYLDGEPTTQESILGVLGRNPTEFLHSILFGQFSNHFLDLGPTDKLDLFSDILGLSFWEEKSDEAKKKANGLQNQIDELVNKTERLSGKLEAMQDQEENLIEQAKKQERQLDSKRERLEDRLLALSRAILQVSTPLEENKDLHDKLQARLFAIEREGRDIEYKLSSAKDKAKRTEKYLANKTCPTCGRSLDATWRVKLREELRAERREISRLEKIASTITEECSKKEKLSKNRASIVVQIQRQLDKNLAEKREVKKQLEELQENEYAKQLTDLRAELITACSNYRRIKSRLDILEVEHERVSFWVKGFRDLRLWILDQSLIQLEMYANNSLSQVGLDRWSIKMAVEREKKSGGITRGFTIDVENPESGESRPWKGWGGGVTQRLCVATEIGLSAMIDDRKNTRPGFEAWDEPTTHLSEAGVRDLLAHLQERAKENNKAIFVIDHRSLDYGFDGEIVVTKTSDGSFVQVV